MDYKTQNIIAGSYRSKFILANGTDRDKSNAIEDLFAKMGWTQELCTGGCPDDTTDECKCTGLMTKLDGDCELTLETEQDGTRYYKAAVKDPGDVEFKCPEVSWWCKQYVQMSGEARLIRAFYSSSDFSDDFLTNKITKNAPMASINNIPTALNTP